MSEYVVLAIYVAGALVASFATGFVGYNDEDNWGLFFLVLVWPLLAVLAVLAGVLFIAFSGPASLGRKAAQAWNTRKEPHS